MRFTTVARIGDGLPLVSTMESVQEEDEISTHKKLAKAILRTLQPDYDYGPGIAGAYKATVLAGDYTFHYSVESGVVFLCLCEKAYPRLLAFSYLSELQKAFFEDVAASSGGSSTGGGAGKAIMSASRPYAFIKFEPIIQSTKRRYLNTRSLRTTEDLLDMSSRIQTFPVMQASELLGPEYYKIMGAS
ncbi:Longin-like domain-containing protein [Cladochytrium replicatum]|nr:Longin-like domain-containing protein [Cladochytrium replicatum]